MNVSDQPERLFSPLAAGLVVVIGVFAFCALLVLFTYASALEGGDDGGGHALSKSAIGFSGLAEALKGLGEPVLVSRHALPAGRHAGLYVLTPPPTAAGKDITAMNFAGPVLVVLPKWAAAPDLKHRGWVSRGLLIDSRMFGKDSVLAGAAVAHAEGVSAPVLTGRAGPFADGGRLQLGPVDAMQSTNLTAREGWTALLTDDRGATILAKADNAPFYVLADPDLLNNQGLKDFSAFASAVAIVNALRAEGGPVIFDVTLDGLGQRRSALSLLFDPPFLAVTLCLATAAGLAGFQAFCRFGPVRAEGRAVALGKEALADNTAALVRLARRESAMGEPYAALTRDLAAKAVGAPRDLAPEALVAFLDRLAARRGAVDSLSELTLLARHAPDRARLTAVATRLFHWRMEMTGES